MSLKNIIEMISFSALLVICILILQYALMNKNSVEKYDPFLKNYKKTNYDIIFMGSSHIYNTVMPQELWKKYKITSYNCGSGCCTLPVDYYILRQVCNYTKPKVVFIDLFELIEFDNLENGNGKYRPDILDQYRVQFDEFPISKLKVESVNDIFDIFDSGTGIIYFADSDQEKSIIYTKNINKIFNNLKVDKVYYYNPSNIKNNNTKYYRELLNYVDGYTSVDEDENPSLDIPSLYFVKNGNIVGYLSPVDKNVDNLMKKKTKKKLQKDIEKCLEEYKRA